MANVKKYLMRLEFDDTFSYAEDVVFQFSGLQFIALNELAHKKLMAITNPEIVVGHYQQQDITIPVKITRITDPAISMHIRQLSKIQSMDIYKALLDHAKKNKPARVKRVKPVPDSESDDEPIAPKPALPKVPSAKPALTIKKVNHVDNIIHDPVEEESDDDGSD